jgi:hypothetical protein
MRKLLITFMITLVINSPSKGYVVTDYDWSEYNGHQYALTFIKGSWLETEAEAAAISFHLVTVNNENENSWLKNTFCLPHDEDLWIGFYQLSGSSEPAGGWVWSSGEPVTFTDWGTNEPTNDPAPEDYVTFSKQHGWQWNDLQVDWFALNGIIETPEPATLLLLGLGGLMLRRRRG